MSRPIPLADIRTSTTSRFLYEDLPSAHSDIDDVFPRTSASDHLDEDLIRPLWKRSLFELLEQPTSSPAAFAFHIFITALIIVSSFVTVLETVPALHSTSGSIWFGIETSLVALFTVEYVARCIAWSGSLRSFVRWAGSFYGIIDLLAILPYYVEIILQKDTSVFFRFSILRVFRLLRVFRPFRSNNTILLTIEVMYLSLRRSQHALLALSFFVVMVLTVFSTLLYFAERGTWDVTLETFINSDGDPSQFSSIPAAAWFVLVTITTVGYGEITPRSFLGRIVTLPLLLFGLLLIALPSFVLGREFSLVWDELSRGHNLPFADGSGSMSLRTPVLDGHDRAPLNPRAPGDSGHGEPRDLSNRKLAQNQTELSRQIAELKSALEAQGEMLRVLVKALGTGSASPRTASPDWAGKRPGSEAGLGIGIERVGSPRR